MIQVEIDSLGNEIGLMKQDLDKQKRPGTCQKAKTIPCIIPPSKNAFLSKEGYYLGTASGTKKILTVSKDIGLFLEPYTMKTKVSKPIQQCGEVQKPFAITVYSGTYFVSLDSEYLVYDLIRLTL